MPAPANFVWPNGSKFALSIVVNVEEGAEQNIHDRDEGPKPVDELSGEPKRPMRMHGNESNYQYGIKAGAPCTLTLLDEHQIRATRTASALALPRHPPSQFDGNRGNRAVLTHLAVENHVSASTQNQALSALLFLYNLDTQEPYVSGSKISTSSAAR